MSWAKARTGGNLAGKIIHGLDGEAMGPKPKPFTERFWAKVQKTEGCCLWTGATNNKGYGKIRMFGSRRLITAHRASWVLAHGPIPDWDGDYRAGTCVLHRCDTPLCVNPEHLYLGTQPENALDRDRKGRHRFVVARGSSNGNALLTEEAVRFIRLNPGLGIPNLASKFGVRERTIRAVIWRESWIHVDISKQGIDMPLEV